MYILNTIDYEQYLNIIFHVQTKKCSRNALFNDIDIDVQQNRKGHTGLEQPEGE